MRAYVFRFAPESGHCAEFLSAMAAKPKSLARNNKTRTGASGNITVLGI